VRHGKRPIADRGLVLTLVDSHGDPLARSNAIRVVGNGRLEVAVTVYEGMLSGSRSCPKAAGRPSAMAAAA
jgi:hypothetical protein